MRAVDALVEPIRPVTIDLYDVAEAGRNAALKRLNDLLALKAVREGEADAYLSIRRCCREIVNAWIRRKRNSRKQINEEKPRGVVFLPHFARLCECRFGRCSLAEVLFGTSGSSEDLGHESRVQRMTGAAGGDFAHDRTSD